MKPNISNNPRSFLKVLLCLITPLLLCVSLPALSVDGYATINGTTTGGQGGPVVTVGNWVTFTKAVQTSGPLIIQVTGTLYLGTNYEDVKSDKTIVGLGANATLVGDLRMKGASNIIIQNITFTNLTGVNDNATHVIVSLKDIINRSLRSLPVSGEGEGAGDGDGITIVGGTHHVWIDHCTFSDCADGQLDITRASDYITVSWCKFFYSITNNTHRFSSLVGASDDNTNDLGTLHVTYHDNWWGSLCVERMPRVRFARIHSYNNYFNSPGNNYCFRAGYLSEILSESNSFENINRPYNYFVSSNAPAGLIHATGDLWVNCTNVLNPIPNDPVFTPPYSYTSDTADAVKSLVIANAGVGKLVTVKNDSGDGSLRRAINQAVSGTIINFAQNLSGQTILLNGQLFVLTNLTIDGSALPKGIILNGNRVGRVLFNGGHPSVLNSLTITNGKSHYQGGGGICNNGTLTVNNCTITGNSTTNNLSGGGIRNEGTLTVNNCTITGNRSSFKGGGLFNIGTLTLNNCTITGNSATNSGGGIYNWGELAGSSGTLTIANCNITTNAAVDTGGGIYNGGSATMNQGTLVENRASRGGGIYNAGSFNGKPPITLTNNYPDNIFETPAR